MGFQRQRDDQPTVQLELEHALYQLAGVPVRIVGAGRTDTGVHATGQIIAFDLAWSHDRSALQRALNVNLPQSIAVMDVEPCSPAFHPRFDARSRIYVYTILNQPVRDPLARFTSWHVKRMLDVERMQAAAATLVGTHDFATFGQPPQGANTVRTLLRADWTDNRPKLTFTIEANAFLNRMVRSIVGTLKAVGDGAMTVAEFREAFQRADRQHAGPTAPPHGLVLTRVNYD